MEHRFLRALQRILDASAFENVGHLRDFEALLQRSDKRDAHESSAEAVSARETAGDAPGATKVVFLASRKVDRDT